MPPLSPPDMESPATSEETPARGCVKLPTKTYPVYEGLNPAGRNPDAVINIKNLNVSKQHSMITIIGNDHYISDFKSSNGTFLNSKKLSPLRLYKLNDGDSIKFGDVYATYKKLDGKQTVRTSVESSQQYSDHFYNACTQEVHLPNVPDGLNLNEMPTQIFGDKELSIGEMPTQVFEPSVTNNESSNDSIDFATMQKAAESQRFKVAENSGSNGKADSDTDDDLVETASKVSSAASSQIHPVKINSKKVLDSDTEDEPPPTQVRGVKKGNNVIESDSDTDEDVQGDATKSKYHISDDSETDIEDDKNEETVETKTEDKKEEKEENSMDDFRLHVSEPMIQNEDKNEEIKTEAVKMSKKVIPVDHVYCQSFTQTQTQDLDTSLRRNEDPSSVASGSKEVPAVSENVPRGQNEERSCAENVPQGQNEETPVTEEIPKMAVESNVNEETEAPHIEKPPVSEETNEDLTPQIALENQEKQNEETAGLQCEEKIEDVEDLFDLATQQLDLDFAGNIRLTEENLHSTLFKKPQDKINVEDKDDDIFLQPTQNLNLSTEGTAKLKSEEKGDDIFLLPTQVIEKTDSGEKVEEATKTGSSEDRIEEPQPSSKNEEEFLPPTQALELLHGDDVNVDTDKILILEKSLTSKEEEELFLPPTQALERLLDEKVAKSPEPSTSKKEEIFLVPDQFKSPSAKKAKKSLEQKSILDEDDFLPPTQALEVMHEAEAPYHQIEDQMHEIFASQSLLCTQQLVDVLETSRNEDVIDDSMLQESSFRRMSMKKNEPITVESVKEILGEDDKIEGLAVNKSLGKNEVKTYSRRKNESQEDKKDGGEEKEESNVRKGRRKQSLVVRDEAPAEDKENEAGSSKINENNKRVERKKQNSEESTEKNAKGKRKNEEKEEVKKDEQKLDSVNADASKTRRGRSSKISSQEKESEGESDKTVSKEDNRRRRGKTPSVSSGEKKLEETTNTFNEKVEQNKDENNRTRRGKTPKLTSQEKEVEKEVNKIQTTTENVQQIDSRTRRGKTPKLEPEKESNKRQTITENAQQTKADDSRTRRGKTPKLEVEKESTTERDRTRRGKTPKLTSQAKESDKDQTEEPQQSKDEANRRTRRGTVKEESKKSQDSNESSTSTRGRGMRKLYRETSLESNKSDSQSRTSSKNDESIKEKTRKGKKSERESSVESKMEESQESGDSQVRRRGRSTINKDETKIKENINSTAAAKTNEREIATTRQSKRKKEETETEATPKKKKPNEDQETKPKSSTPKKRTLKFPSYDSENDFATKIPKVSESEKNPTRTRKQKQEEEKEEKTDVASSSSSNVSTPTRQRRLSANSRQKKKEEELNVNKEEEKKGTRRRETSTLSVATPDRSRRVVKPKVVFTMMDSPELESLIRQLGGSVVDSVDSSTVLVTESVKRSMKLLRAVAQGKPICGPQWLQACKKAFSFVDPWEHILTDKEAEKKWNFSLRESLDRANNKKLLENYTFQLIVNNAADVLKGAIEACGGKCVTRSLASCDSEHLIIVSEAKNRSKFSKIVNQNSKIRVVEAEAIFDGTLRQEFNFDKHLVK